LARFLANDNPALKPDRPQIPDSLGWLDAAFIRSTPKQIPDDRERGKRIKVSVVFRRRIKICTDEDSFAQLRAS